MMLDTQAEQAAFDDAAFRAWMQRVDVALVRRCGLTSDDLPDYPYRDAYDAGEPPEVVAECALEESGFEERD